MNGLISLIIPTFNVEEFIDKCLDSVFLQDYPNLEIIVVDDGSSDSTYDLVRKRLDNNKLILLRNPKKGVSAARNFGIENASGQYVTFVDADDLISEDFISTLSAMVIDESDCDCGIVAYTNDLKLLGYHDGPLETEIENDIDIYIELLSAKSKIGGYVWNKIYRLDIIKNHDIQFDETLSIGEDLLFNYQYFAFARKTSFAKATLYYYRLYPNSSFYALNNNRWFNYIDVYLRLLKLHASREARILLEYNLANAVLEAKYRYKFCDYSKYSLQELDDLADKYLHYSKDYTLIQNIKLYIFRHFPTVTMKYKRRQLRKGT